MIAILDLLSRELEKESEESLQSVKCLLKYNFQTLLQYKPKKCWTIILDLPETI